MYILNVLLKIHKNKWKITKFRILAASYNSGLQNTSKSAKFHLFWQNLRKISKNYIFFFTTKYLHEKFTLFLVYFLVIFYLYFNTFFVSFLCIFLCIFYRNFVSIFVHTFCTPFCVLFRKTPKSAKNPTFRKNPKKCQKPRFPLKIAFRGFPVENPP